jgi:hypothetical protein
MEDAAKILTEDSFRFPDYAAIIAPSRNAAYAVGRVRQVRGAKDTTVIMQPKQKRLEIFRHEISTTIYQAVLVRSLWAHATGPWDGAGPVRLHGFLDGELILNEPMVEGRMRRLGPKPLHACACNGWNESAACVCLPPVGHLPAPKGGPAFLCSHPAERFLATSLSPSHEALPDQLLGVFALNGGEIALELVKEHGDPIDGLQLRCGMTAALYSTSTKDCPSIMEKVKP